MRGVPGARRGRGLLRGLVRAMRCLAAPVAKTEALDRRLFGDDDRKMRRAGKGAKTGAWPIPRQAVSGPADLWNGEPQRADAREPEKLGSDSNFPPPRLRHAPPLGKLDSDPDFFGEVRFNLMLEGDCLNRKAHRDFL